MICPPLTWDQVFFFSSIEGKTGEKECPIHLSDAWSIKRPVSIFFFFGLVPNQKTRLSYALNGSLTNLTLYKCHFSSKNVLVTSVI